MNEQDKAKIDDIITALKEIKEQPCDMIILENVNVKMSPLPSGRFGRVIMSVTLFGDDKMYQSVGKLIMKHNIGLDFNT